MYRSLILTNNKMKVIESFEGERVSDAEGQALAYIKKHLPRGLPYIIRSYDSTGKKVHKEHRIHGTIPHPATETFHKLRDTKEIEFTEGEYYNQNSPRFSY